MRKHGIEGKLRELPPDDHPVVAVEDEGEILRPDLGGAGVWPPKPVGLRTPTKAVKYTSIRYTERLYEIGAAPSVGSRGDAYDNAMAEARVATFKSELVDGRRFPSFEHAEHEVLHWIGFYNEERLHEALGDSPPVEYEELNIKRDNTPMVAAT
jgi:putative transposase